MLFIQTSHNHLRFVPSKLLTIVAVRGAAWFPYFQVERDNYLQEITWEEGAMPFRHLVANGAQVLSVRLPFHLEGRHFAKYSSAWTAYSKILLNVLLRYAIYNVYEYFVF